MLLKQQSVSLLYKELDSNKSSLILYCFWTTLLCLLILICNPLYYIFLPYYAIACNTCHINYDTSITQSLLQLVQLPPSCQVSWPRSVLSELSEELMGKISEYTMIINLLYNQVANNHDFLFNKVFWSFVLRKYYCYLSAPKGQSRSFTLNIFPRELAH